ncbi:hypothetical protein [Stetteria hydrogenophila]
MARRRRRRKLGVVRRVKKPARYFTCPVCHKFTLTIDFKKSDKPGTKIAVVRCGSCGLNLNLEVPEVYEAVDVYGLVVDKVHSGEIEAAEAEGGELEAENVEEEEGAELPAREETEG